MARFMEQLIIRGYLLCFPSKPKLGGTVLEAGDASSYRRWDLQPNQTAIPNLDA